MDLFSSLYYCSYNSFCQQPWFLSWIIRPLQFKHLEWLPLSFGQDHKHPKLKCLGDLASWLSSSRPSVPVSSSTSLFSVPPAMALFQFLEWVRHFPIFVQAVPILCSPFPIGWCLQGSSEEPNPQGGHPHYLRQSTSLSPFFLGYFLSHDVSTAGDTVLRCMTISDDQSSPLDSVVRTKEHVRSGPFCTRSCAWYVRGTQ